jgi:hypothetical protein
MEFGEKLFLELVGIENLQKIILTLHKGIMNQYLFKMEWFLD